MTVDPWGASPLVDQFRRSHEFFVELAEKEAPAPTLFESGDLPPFTASGVDPEMLKRLPYTARHAAAAEPDRAKVFGMIEQYGKMPEALFRHEGLDAYRRRVEDWVGGNHAANGAGESSQPISEKDAETLYDGVFGEVEKAQRARQAPRRELERQLRARGARTDFYIDEAGNRVELGSQQ